MDDIQRFIGNVSFTVSDAMRKIDKNSCGILFLVDNEKKLIGCITDGDIRRFLLAGGSIMDSSLKAANRNPKVARSYDEAVALYHGRDYVVIPILDDNNTIIEVYAGDEKKYKKRTPLNTPVVINAGGRGTRLDPYTRVLPKPLIPIGDMPIIEHIMKGFQSYMCDRFHIIVNYKKGLIKAFFSDNTEYYDITWHDEAVPLGTGGGLTLLKGIINETFFFSNCDVMLTANYGSMMKFHKENGNLITMACAYKNLDIPYGVVEMGVNGSIIKMEEKPHLSFLTNTGVYIVEPEVIDDMQGGVAIGFPDVIEKLRRKGRKVAVFPVSEQDWMDMGQLPELEKMNIRLYGG